jgi:hypothetical protein
MGWHDFLVYGLYRLVKAGANAALKPKPCSHGVIGACQACEVERKQHIEEEFARSPEGVELARQEKLREIAEAYESIDEATRTRLRVTAEERIKRLNLRAGEGDVEVAVVNMYRRSQRNQFSK